MRFFSVYDLIVSRSKDKNMTNDDMFSFFSARKISKATLISLQQTLFSQISLHSKMLLQTFWG